MGLYKRKSSSYWWCDYTFKGRQVRESTKTTNRRKALDYLKLKEAEALKGVPIHTYAKTTLEDLKDAVIIHYKDKERKTLPMMERTLRTLGNFFDMRMMDISELDIQKYKAKRIKEGMAKSSIDRELAALKLGLNLLKRYDKIGSVPYIEMYNVGMKNAKQIYLTWDEYQKFLTALRELEYYHLIGPVRLAVAVGWRKETILSLEWKHVDRKNQIIIAPGILNKNGEPTTYPYDIDAIVQDVINQQWRKRKDLTCPYVFMNREGTDRVSVDIRECWNRAVKHAKIKGGLGYGCKGKGFTFHDLKRTFFNISDDSGMSQNMMMEISGTKDAGIFRRYNIIDKERMRKAIGQRQAYLDKVNQKKPFNEVEEEAKAFRKS